MTELFNPFTGETVDVSKAVSPMYGAKHAFTDQPTKRVGALLPTGSHVSHANDLLHIKGKKVGRTPSKTQLVRVTGTHAGGVGKGLFGTGKKAKQVQASLDMVRKQPKPTGAGSTSNSARIGKSDLSGLGSQPGMINPGVVTSSWSHGTPNQNFAAANGRRGRKIS